MAVLLIAAVVIALSGLGFLVVAVVTRALMKRLALDPWAVLLWFGLAEAQTTRPPLRPVPTRVSRRSAAAPGT